MRTTMLVWCGVVLGACTATTRSAAAAPESVLSRAMEGPDVGAPSLAGHHVLFVAGFLNEAIAGYFVENARTAQDLGATTSTLAPPSSLSLEENAALVGAEVDARADEPGLVLVGHSMGGASALLTVLDRPELVLDGRVACVIVVQGAVGGSPVADALSPLVPGLRGLASLTTSASRAAFAQRLDTLHRRLSPADRERLFAHVFYVRSFHANGRVAAELLLSERALRSSGPNDGLLVQRDMKLAEGIDLGAVESDHASLMVAGPLSAKRPEAQRRFTRALFREVGGRLGW